MKTINLRFAFLLVPLLWISSLAVAFPKHSTSKKIKILDIGIVLRLSDKVNDTISNLVAGMETAKALFEQSHPGIQIHFHRYNHSDSLESVVSASFQAVSDSIPAIIGGELSEESQVLRDLVSKKNIVFITPTSSSPAITEGYPFSFRACFSDRLVSSQLAQFTLKQLKPKSLGVIHNVSSVYTDFFSKQFINTFQEAQSQNGGARILLLEEKIGEETMSYEEQIKALQENRVTHVALFTHRADALRFVLQASEKGFFPIYLGTDSWGSNEFVSENFIDKSPYGKQFVAYRTVFWKEDTQNPWVAQFRKAYYSKYQTKPDAWGAMGFDTAWILMTAMYRAPDPKNSNQIQKEMEKLKHLPLVTHPDFSFGPDHSPKQSPAIYRMDKSGIHYEGLLR